MCVRYTFVIEPKLKSLKDELNSAYLEFNTAANNNLQLNEICSACISRFLSEQKFKNRKRLKILSSKEKENIMKKANIILGNSKAKIVSMGKEGHVLSELVEADMSSEYLMNFLLNMSLIYLVSIFEGYLFNVLRILLKYKRKNDIALNAPTTNEQSRIKKMESSIENKVDKISRGDINKIKDYINSTFGFNLESDESRWKKFTEFFYRRNIVVHNDGKVDRLYRLKTGYTGKKERLRVSEEYLDGATYSFRFYVKIIKKSSMAIISTK